MNIESVKTLFELFSGEQAEDFAPLITLAAAETEKMLLPAADSSDIRLDFLAAAIANFRLRQIKASRDRSQVTYAGKMLKADGDSSAAYAGKLLRDYLQLCGDLIRPRTFIFAGFSGKEDLC